MKFLERSLDNQNQVWKYIIMTISVWIIAQLIGSIPLLVAVAVQTLNNGIGSFNAENIMNFSAIGISQNFGLFLIMIPFVAGLLFMIPLLKSLHKRTLTETINGRKKIRWSRCFTGIIVWTILMGIYLLIDYLVSPKNFVFQFDITKFIPLLLISLLLIPWQTSFEEVFFRGYLTQGVAAWTKNRWLAIIIPGFIFGLIHLSNPEVKEFGFLAAMPQYICFGLFFGLISVLDDGIELALGVHAANNIFLSIFVTHSASAFQTPAVLQQLSIDPYEGMFLMFIMSFIAVCIFAKKYHWNFNILNKKITNESTVNLPHQS